MNLRYLILPLLITSSVHADALLPSDDSVYYSDSRIRYTAKLGEVETAAEKAIRIKAEREAEKLKREVAKRRASSLAEKKRVAMPVKELNTPIEVSFREKNLPSAIRSLTPPGWVVDLQIDEGLYATQVGFSGETTYKQALNDILKPQGLTFLAYRNMKPKPLIVITQGGNQ